MGWLALLLIRITENTTGDTWANIRNELDRLHLITLATGDGHVAQRSMLTPGQKKIPDRPRPARTAKIPRLHRHHQLT